MMEVHVCNRGGSLLRAYAVGDSPEIIIGREDTCDIRINSRTVSREHCAIERDGERLYLRDLESTAGTLLGGRKIDRVRLVDGLEVVIGPVVLKFFEGAV